MYKRNISGYRLVCLEQISSTEKLHRKRSEQI